MNRPIGVTAIALLVLGSSIMTVAPVLTHRGSARSHELLVSSGFLLGLAVIAAEALWNLRRHAFMTFVLWGLCAMLTTVLAQLVPWSPGRGIRLMGPIVCAGIVYAIATLYLRRAL